MLVANMMLDSVLFQCILLNRDDKTVIPFDASLSVLSYVMAHIL